MRERKAAKPAYENKHLGDSSLLTLKDSIGLKTIGCKPVVHKCVLEIRIWGSIPVFPWRIVGVKKCLLFQKGLWSANERAHMMLFFTTVQKLTQKSWWSLPRHTLSWWGVCMHKEKRQVIVDPMWNSALLKKMSFARTAGEPDLHSVCIRWAATVL